MNTRDVITHRIHESLNRPSDIAEMNSVMFSFSAGFWHASWEGRDPDTWECRRGMGTISIKDPPLQTTRPETPDVTL